jgi:hypothetical protein
MKRTAPENGYESPRSPDCEEGFFGNDMGNGTHKAGERRRAGRNGQAFVGGQGPETQDRVGKNDADLGREEERETKKVGIRDRLGCYTWTWFTMTMATGGIANVLHSSNRQQCLPSIASDYLQFLIDLNG